MLKTLEIFIRRVLNQILSGKSNPLFVSRPSFVGDFSKINRILLLRQDRIGDVLISTPLFKIMKEQLSGIKIDILLGVKNQGTRNAISKYFNEIYILEKGIFKFLRVLRKLKDGKYDLVIDLFDNESTTSNLLLKLINPRYKLGFEKNNSGVYTHTVPLLDKSKVHIVERLMTILYPFGINPNTSELKPEYDIEGILMEAAKSKLGDKSGKTRIGINVAGSGTSKYWGIDNIIDFIGLLQRYDDGIELIIFGTRIYTSELQTIRERENIRIAPFTEILDEYAAMLSLCDYIITPDTSAVHFASSFQIPCVAMYNYDSLSDLVPWTPYNSPYKAIYTNEGTIAAIKADEVFEAFKLLYENRK